MIPAGLGVPVQVAYAVPDVDAAAVDWARRFGAGPFLVRRHIELAEVLHRGRPGVFDHSSAYGQWGPVMVELVQDHGSGPSVVRDRFGPQETGLHHLAFIVDDLAAAVDHLVGEGFVVASSARTEGGTWFHFLEDPVGSGPMLELYQRSERLEGFYALVAQAASDRTGTDPVREA